MSDDPKNIDFAPARVLVVGDVMLDRYWFGDVDRISPEAPVPVVRVNRTEERLGGAGNVARNAAALGATVGLIGVVGTDEAASRIGELLKGAGVQARLVRDANGPTTMKMRVIGRQQQLLRVDFEEAPHASALGAVETGFADLLGQFDVVVFSDYAKGALARIPGLIRAARAAGRTVLVDPKGDDYSRYRGASLVTPNRSEARQAMGNWRDEDDLAIRARRLLAECEIGALLVTRSEDGMTLITPQSSSHVEAQAREVFDVTGAGDTVIATMASALGAGMPMADAMRWANKAAGIVVGKLGTSTVTPEELFAQEKGQ